MNPETNRFEELSEASKEDKEEFLEKIKAGLGIAAKNSPFLLRPDGSPVPKHWTVFKVGEKVVIKNYTFKVAYIGETSILFEPVGPLLIGEKDE